MKPGIVGRTGGGKSNLHTSTIPHSYPCTGKILIDGILSYSSMHKVHAFLNNHLCLPNFLDVIFELRILSDFYREI